MEWSSAAFRGSVSLCFIQKHSCEKRTTWWLQREREREHERTLREQKITKDSVSRGKTPPRVSPFGGVRCIFGHVRDVSNGLFNGCASCTPSLVESAARPLRTSARPADPVRRRGGSAPPKGLRGAEVPGQRRRTAGFAGSPARCDAWEQYK